MEVLNKNTLTRVDTEIIGTKKNTFQLELKNRFTALDEQDDMYSLNKNMTELIQQSATVEPAFKGHPRDQANVSRHDRCPLVRD